MSTKLTSLATAHYILLARSFVVIVGGLAVWWGIAGFSVFWHESSTERIANRIISGDPFKVEILARQLPIINSIETSVYCRPAALRSAAIIQLRMVEAATPPDQHSDEHSNSLRNIIRSSLSCAPADPFLWLVLYWVESAKNNFKPEYFKYLRMSYLLGPNEGWIAVKRSRIALAIISALPPDLAEAGISEFVGLVRSRDFYSEAADIVAGPARPIRGLLFARLRDINEANRQAFAKLLYDRSLDDVLVPGIEPLPQGPWR